MALVLSEAKRILKPQLTSQQANDWLNETDQLLWIEYNIFPLANVQSSINTTFGELLACWIEDEFEAILS